MRNILVIGGSGYIGREVALGLMEMEECNVVATYHQNTPDKIDKSKLIWKKCDITKNNDLSELSTFLNNSFTKLDGIVIAVGAKASAIFSKGKNRYNFPRADEIDECEFEELLKLNGIGIYKTIKCGLELLKNGENPNIIIIGSLTGLKAVFSPVHFATSKSCIRGMVESLAKDLGEYNVKVNSVDPGILEGGQGSFLSDDSKADYLKHCSLRRFGTAKEVADTVCWMILENTFITGKSILLDGGL